MSGLRVCLFAEFRNKAYNDYINGKTNEFVKALLMEMDFPRFDGHSDKPVED